MPNFFRTKLDPQKAYYSMDAPAARPDLLDAYFGRARSLVRLHDWERAEADLRFCLKDENLRSRH